ncbi:beta-amyrin 11-oxidase-like [Abrus precatorius]|uniref:Beta-amyrin 11-oxidase-like n=1 Tax=Abrus precatorius TaxID=3816 RepID=A0A8B8KW38_ABRPR|nr:beta-amyrin 11-oxidase-like [Abrus precatorius]
MELHWVWMSLATLFTSYVFVKKIVRRLNEWYYDLTLRNKQHPLPPGDMGWPIIGNLLAFAKDYSSGHPDLLLNNLVSKYGATGIYKTHLFGKPSIIVCAPDMCKRVLTDDESFRFGYPSSSSKLARSRALNEVSSAEHRRFRRLVTAPIVGHNMLAVYIQHIEEIVINSLEEMSSMKHPFAIMKELKRISTHVIVHIFLGSRNQHIFTKIGDLFTDISKAMFSVPINVPGFSFHKALKARERLANIVQSVVDERKMMIKNGEIGGQKDLIDILLHVNGQNGEKLEDEDIIDLLIVFLFAGGESTAAGMMMTIAYLTQHPHILKKAKDEQEEIMKARPSSQKQLTLKEIKQMVYLSQVIDEMLRRANPVFSIFREAAVDVNINGYIIPKGWKVLVWIRAVHMDPENFPNPQEFNPSRWDDCKGKAGNFLPFGAGSKLCPGSDLTKLEISIFMHYFLLNYKVELMNPQNYLTYFPAPKLINNCLAKVIKISCA